MPNTLTYTNVSKNFNGQLKLNGSVRSRQRMCNNFHKVYNLTTPNHRTINALNVCHHVQFLWCLCVSSRDLVHNLLAPFRSDVPYLMLTLSPPIPLRLYTLPYWSNPPFIIFDIRALWRSVLSARAPECQQLKMVG